MYPFQRQIEEKVIKLSLKLQRHIKRLQVKESVIELLDELQNLRITYNILQRTGIRETVLEIQEMVSDEAISAAAKVLLGKWDNLSEGDLSEANVMCALM